MTEPYEFEGMICVFCGRSHADATAAEPGEDWPFYVECFKCHARGPAANSQAEAVAAFRLNAPTAAPAGWVLVPRKPTEAMLESTLDKTGQRIEPYTAERESGVAIESDMDEETANYCNLAAKEGFASVYSAMLSAAPVPSPPTAGLTIRSRMNDTDRTWFKRFADDMADPEMTATPGDLTTISAIINRLTLPDRCPAMPEFRCERRTGAKTRRVKQERGHPSRLQRRPQDESWYGPNAADRRTAKPEGSK